MAIDSQTNWYVLVMSSAVVSALVNVSWNAYSKRKDRIKEEKEKARRVGHVYLDIILDLESFAKNCNAYIFDVESGLFELSEEQDSSSLNAIKPLKFIFNATPLWIELPVEFVARVKSIPNQLESTSEWILEQWQAWADLDEVYQLEVERAAFYGLKVCEITKKLRDEIGADNDETKSYVEHFQAVLSKRRRMFQNIGKKFTLIPELHAQFEQERLSLEDQN